MTAVSDFQCALMKNALRLTTLALMLGLLPFAAVHAAKARKAVPKDAAAPAAVTEIELVSELPPGNHDALVALVNRFNEQEKSAHVTVVDRDWKGGSAPHLLILDEASEQKFVASGRFKPVSQLMREAGEKLETVKGVNPVVYSRAADKKGGLAGLPIGLSTPVLFVNQDLFRKSGVDPVPLPTTWGQVQKTAAKLRSGGVACPLTTVRPARVLLENALAWQNEPFLSAKGQLAINGLMPIRHLALMSSWVRAGLLHLYGHGDEAIEHFAKGECAMLLAGQSAMPGVGQGGFSVGVGPMPYYDDAPGAPQNTLADGLALWVSSGKTVAENKAAARFISYWLQPTQQIDWMRTAGYLPLTRAGAFAASGSALGSELQNIQVAVKQLTGKPATAASRASVAGHDAGLHEMLENQLDAVWADTKAPKQALDEAVANTARKGKR